MPELPEVETTVRSLRPLLAGRRIVSARADARIVRRGSRPMRALRGATVVAVERTGKVIVVRTRRGAGDDGPTLAVHLGMTGGVRVVPRPCRVRAPAHRHLVVRLADGSELWLVDPRRFGYAWVGGPGSPAGALNVGPDAMAVGAAELAARLARRRAPVKALLLDQRLVAGVGNIYADEILFAARVDPRAPGRGAARHAAAIVDAMRGVLRSAIARGGTTIRDFRAPDGRPGGFGAHLAVYGRHGRPCVRCGARVRRVVLAGRSTHWCPACQRRGRVRRPGP